MPWSLPIFHMAFPQRPPVSHVEDVNFSIGIFLKSYGYLSFLSFIELRFQEMPRKSKQELPLHQFPQPFPLLFSAEEIAKESLTFMISIHSLFSLLFLLLAVDRNNNSCITNLPNFQPLQTLSLERKLEVDGRWVLLCHVTFPCRPPSIHSSCCWR